MGQEIESARDVAWYEMDHILVPSIIATIVSY